MSGIEIAGLVVPILLTALENWESCVRPFKRFRKFDQEAQDFCDEVGIQRAIFQNECGLLLHEVEEHDVVKGMLDSLDHKDWRDENIDRNLARHLGSSLSGVQLTIKLLIQELSRLNEVIEGLRDIVTQATQVL